MPPPPQRFSWKRLLLLVAMGVLVLLLNATSGIGTPIPTLKTTSSPTKRNTKAPTKRPSASSYPSRAPRGPTYAPSLASPSQAPITTKPSKSPTTSKPTKSPTHAPSFAPTQSPTRAPSTSPTLRENGAFFSLTLYNINHDYLVAAPTRLPTGVPTVRRVTTSPFSPTAATETLQPSPSPTARLRRPTRLPTTRRRNLLLSSRRKLMGSSGAISIPSSSLPSPDLDESIAWDYVYQGVHCLVDFLMQARGMAYSDLYLGAVQNANCTSEDAERTCFPARFHLLITPTGGLSPNSSICGVPRCPSCDEVCVFAYNFDRLVRPLLHQDKLFVLGSTLPASNVSDVKNLLPGIFKHTLSPSSRFCRADFLDDGERKKIFDESPLLSPSVPPDSSTPPPTTANTQAPTLSPDQRNGTGITPVATPPPQSSGDTTTAIVLGVIGSIALLLAIIVIYKRNRRRTRKRRQEKQRLLDASSADGKSFFPSKSGGGGGGGDGPGGGGGGGNSLPAGANRVKTMSEYMEDEYAINLSHLLIGQPIGSGSSGQIYAARYEGSDVCIKEIVVRGDIVMLKKEFDTLRRLKNPHVIQLFGFAIANTMNQKQVGTATMRNDAVAPEVAASEANSEEESFDAYQPDFPRFLLMMELMDTSLDKLILKKLQLFKHEGEDVVLATKKEHLDWALDIAKQVSLGLRYIHGKDVLHCDVKPHNILLDKAGTVKLCDLGISKVINAAMNSGNTAQQQQGTVSYMSPELLRENKITKAVDVYAFGIVMWQLFHLQPPHPDFHTRQEVIEQVLVHDFRPEIDPRLDEGIANLIRKCWATDPSDRPTFSQIIQELGDITNLENQFGTVYLETIFSVGDNVLVFTLKNQLGSESGLMKGKIDAVNVNPAGGFVYNVVLEDGSKIYALHPSDMLLQKPEPKPPSPPAEATLGDAITKVMEEGLEVRRNKKKPFSRLRGFPKKSLARPATANVPIVTPPTPVEGFIARRSRQETLDHLLFSQQRPHSDPADVSSRIKSHSSAPAPLRTVSNVGGTGLPRPQGSSSNTNNSSSKQMMDMPLPSFALSLDTDSNGGAPPLDQTFKYDGESFVFNSGLRLQDSGIIAGAVDAKAASNSSGNGSDHQLPLRGGGAGGGSSDHNVWDLNTNRSKYDERKIIRVGRLGQGDAGTVYSAMHEDTMEVVAIKEVTKFFDRTVRMQAKRELEALIELEHENIVRLHSVYFNSGHSSISFVLEYVLGGSLQDLVIMSGKLTSEPGIKRIASDMVSALAFCHEKKIAHLDVKPANVLLTLGGQAKLSDFGLARIFRGGEANELANTFVGSSLYMSPERVNGQPYSFPADIWGLGLTLAFAALGKYPLTSGNKLLNMLAEFRSPQGEGGGPIVLLPKEFSPGLHEFVQSCLVNQPGKRATALQLKQSEWLLDDAKASKQDALPATKNRVGTLLLAEFIESYAQRWTATRGDIPMQLSEEQRNVLVKQFHLTPGEVQRIFDAAFSRLSLSSTITSQDSSEQLSQYHHQQQQQQGAPSATTTTTTATGGMHEYDVSVI